MNPISQSKSNDIISVLSDLSVRSPSNRFKLRIYKRDAEAIAAHSPVEGYTVLGAIACMEHDFSAMHGYHKLAIDHSGRSIYALVNYAVSLSKSFLWKEALLVYEEAYRIDQTNIETLRFLINANFRSGFLSKATNYLDTWDKLCPAKPYQLKNSVLESRAFLSTLPVTEEDIIHVINVVADELSKTEAMENIFHFNSISEEGHRYINFEIECIDTASNLYELESMIDSVICESVDPRIMDYVVITICHPPETTINSFEMADEGCLSERGNFIDFKQIKDLIKDVEPL